MQQLEHYQQIIVPVLKKFNIKRASIFGSIAKGLETNTSDLDLLIEPEAGFTLFTLIALENEITHLTKRKIDIVEFGALKPSIKTEVLQSAIAIL
ncbi:nucleotidyltransferase domain-containing protein [uncultured Mucilaginibacter sp.]|uniref:nucleotidyltransferase family protein n=1 Tax=uncultured Mucilaginibacter sp. TaxID=797541 RepID=UPI0026343B9C|nr:nucleotidyltransferase domain-containing protein [uncultured Mucilaginibacter sp.]